MSRHRNVRSMNYTDEYDGYDDVYGHSVEDDYTISPSDAAFMYDRNRQPQQMAAFLNEEDDIAEVDESELDSENAGPQRRDSETYHRPALSEIDEARLRSCLDEIRNVLGETVSEQVLVETVLKNKFNVATALDEVLSSAASSAKVEDPHSKRQRERRDIGKDQAGAKRPAISTTQSEPAVEFSALNLSQNVEDKVPPVTVTPSIKVVPSGTRKQNVTKGFNVADGNESLKADSNCPTPRSGSPSSGRATPAIDDSRTPRNREKNVSALYAAERGDRKDQLHMVVIGHVDAGKSTLMGHLLYSLGQVNKKTMHKYEQESKKIGKQSFVYAWILDETGEERSRGVTMDVGHSQFETATKSVTLLDAPGHKDFIPNMITGATQADVAFLVVDATRGEFETGFESGGQTREHTLLVRSLGVSQLGVAVNKMETVGWSQDRFEEIVQKLGSFLKQAGFRERDVKFVPCSGLTGENLVAKPTEDLLNQWYNGPCLLDVIDGFAAIERPITKPFRMSLNDIFKGVGSGFSVSGRVETGAVQVGDRVLVQPLNEPAQIKALLIDEMPAAAGYAGDQVSLTLAGVDMGNVAVGNILCDPAQPIPVTSKFEARIVVFNIDIPITKGCTVILHHQSLLEQAVVTRLVAQLHKSSGEVVKRRPRCLARNSTALVEITTARPVGMELYQNVKELGRFMLRVGGITVAAGLVTKIF